MRDPAVRGVAYWAHVVAPLRESSGCSSCTGWRGRACVGASGSGGGSSRARSRSGWSLLHSAGPACVERRGPRVGRAVLLSVARAYRHRQLHPGARRSMMDDYCLECHADVHESVVPQRPPLQLVQQPGLPHLGARDARGLDGARRQRAGRTVLRRLSRPGPVLQRRVRRPGLRRRQRPDAHAGITCTACHAITHINSPRGNSDYTIEEPTHYPFANSENALLAWVNRQLVKAKPAFHKKTFLKPLHKTTEFCGTCHKVHLPEELNGYKWLRGQNHYDSFLLSGVSGHGVVELLLPAGRAARTATAATCRCTSRTTSAPSPTTVSGRPHGPRPSVPVGEHRDPPPRGHASGRRSTRTASSTEGVMRVDVFGVQEGGTIDGALIAPLRPECRRSEPGRSYLLETVITHVKARAPRSRRARPTRTRSGSR